MIGYQPAAFRPIVSSPALGPESRFLGQVPLILGYRHTPPALQPAPAPTLGRAELGQTFDQLMGWPAFMGDVLRLVFHGGTAYLGTHVGLKEKGAVRWIAWILGVGNGLAAVADVISLIQRAFGTHPPEWVPPPPPPKTGAA